MTNVILEGWKEGLEKISLTRLQAEKLGTSLSESKRNVDLLLDDNTIILEFANEEIAQDFAVEAEKIGVICRIESV